MVQKPFQWFRRSKASREKQKQAKLQTEPHAQLFTEPPPAPIQSRLSQRFFPNRTPSSQSPPASPNHLTEQSYFQTLPQPFDPNIRESETSVTSSANSSIPFHSPSSPPPRPQPLPDVVPLESSNLPQILRSIPRSRSSRRVAPEVANPVSIPKNFDNQNQSLRDQTRDWRQNGHARIAFGRNSDPSLNDPSSDPQRYTSSESTNPASPVYSAADPTTRSLDDGNLSFEVSQRQSNSLVSEAGVVSGQSSVANSAVDFSIGLLDHFVPHRPADRFGGQEGLLAAPNGADFTFSAVTAEKQSVESANLGTTSGTEGLGGRYLKKLGDPQSRFIFRRRRNTPAAPVGAPEQQVPVEDDYFGATQHDERGRSGDIRAGEEVLIKFLRNTLGPKAQNLAVRLMNKTPITSSSGFTYVIHQGTEESDIDIIRRDLTSGRLYSSGVRLLGGAWCNLLLGDRFAPGAAPRQRHELTYRRSSCSCIICRVKGVEILRAAESDARSQSEFGSDAESVGVSADVLSTMSTSSRTPIHSAMANFVVRGRLPDTHKLMWIGASSSSRELEIGSVVRLNYRASAKLKFTDDVRELFGHYAYTGPISHEEVYRRVTTIGVHYYLYNKGKKERKVYIQGELIRLPIDVGVIKLGTQPMFMPELGATFCLHRKQIMSIYVGEIVLEGNSIGSFINTGIRYYIGFGEERGVCPVYPNKTLGKARKLGINELLLHHHMVDDLEVRCV